jgi:Domain of unknown function (DUF4389)
LIGGGWSGWRGGSNWGDKGDWGGGRWGGPGLIDLLVFFAAIALLFTTRYPRGIFDFVLGLNRWVARVAAYVALMTDRYRPFRLDQGPDDPADVAAPGEPVAPAAPGVSL